MPKKELGFLSVQWVEYKCWTADCKRPYTLITGTLRVTFSTHSCPCFRGTPQLSCCLPGNKALADPFFFISKLRKGQSSFKHLTIWQLWHCEEAALQHFTWAPGLTCIFFLRRKARPTCDRFHRKLTVTVCLWVLVFVYDVISPSKTNCQKLKVDRSIELSVLSFQKLLVYNCIDT